MNAIKKTPPPPDLNTPRRMAKRLGVPLTVVAKVLMDNPSITPSALADGTGLFNEAAFFRIAAVVAVEEKP